MSRWVWTQWMHSRALSEIWITSFGCFFLLIRIIKKKLISTHHWNVCLLGTANKKSPCSLSSLWGDAVFLQWLPADLIVDETLSHSIGRTFRQTLNGSGLIVTPAFPFKLGNVSPSGTHISNVCRNDEKNRKISMRARTSPRHMRRPTPKGRKYSGFVTFPSELMKRFGLNFSGSSHKVGSMWTAWRSGITWALWGSL